MPERIDTNDVRFLLDFIDGYDMPAAGLDATAAYVSVAVRTDPDLERWRAALTGRWQRVSENRGISKGSLVAILTASSRTEPPLPNVQVTLVRPALATEMEAAS